jgi:hypothetical protein
MKSQLLGILLVVLVFAASISAQQRADMTLSLNDAFFDAVLESIFQNFDPPSFPIKDEKTSGCDESIKVLREMNGVRTAVRFREGKVFVPLAFSGHYSAPFVGCLEFAGWAETNIDVEFDRDGQRLVGRAHVLNVNLNGTGGVGGGMIASTLQSSIDRRVNPIEIMKLNSVSFTFPIRSAGNLRMRAIAVRPEISNGQMNLVITYEFLKG